MSGAIALTLAHAPAHAQTPTPAEIQAAYEAVLREPNNVALSYRYAQLQTSVGNFEAAVGVLERLLIVVPNLPRLRFDIGALYLRMNSPQMAVSYLRHAAEDPNSPPDIRARSATLLQQAERMSSPSQLSGDLTVGLRFDTNANLAATAVTGSNLVPATRPRRDGAVVAITRGEHIYAIGGSDDLALVSTYYLFGTRQFSVSDVNVLLGDFTSGPRFRVIPNLFPGATLRPHVVLGVSSLGNRFYGWSYGGGFDLSFTWSDTWSTDLTFQHRTVDTRSSSVRPDANLLAGTDDQVRLRVRHQLDQPTAIFVEVGLRRVDTRRDYLNYREAAVTVTATREVRLGTWQPWIVSIYGAVIGRRYDALDIAVDPIHTRREVEWRAGASNLIPVRDGFYLLQQIDWSHNSANLVAYDRRNVAVTLAAVLRY